MTNTPLLPQYALEHLHWKLSEIVALFVVKFAVSFLITGIVLPVASAMVPEERDDSASIPQC